MPTTHVPRFSLQSAFPSLERRETVRLHPRKGNVTSPLSSKLGGTFGWPSNEALPLCHEHGTPLVPVLQIARTDVPELPFPTGTDLFQLVWCPRDHASTGYGPSPVVFWRSLQDLDGTCEVTSPAGDADKDYLPSECCLSPERVSELPSAFELPPEVHSSLDQWILDHARSELVELGIDVKDLDPVFYQYHFSVAPGTKVGGHINWIQDPEVPACECGKPMNHLLTMASAEFDGSYQRWLPLEDRSVWRQPYAVRNAVQRAAGLMLGDMGSLFIFYCSTCGPRTVRAIMQCS